MDYNLKLVKIMRIILPASRPTQEDHRNNNKVHDLGLEINGYNTWVI